MGVARPSLGRRYAADCGTPTQKFLSRAASIATRHYYRPGKTVDGERYPFSVFDDFGAHTINGLERRPLIKYGVGADLYFKGLKALSCIFFGVALLSLPAILATYTASPDPNRDAVLAQAPPQILYYASLGAWGPSSSIPCGEILEGSMELACPAGATMVDIKAYYGNVKGGCRCPASHKPDVDGACPGRPSSKTSCRNKPCFSGTTLFGEACCSSIAKADGRPDFKNVHPSKGTCDAHIETLARDRCLGQRNCSLATLPLNCSTSPKLIAFATCREPKLSILGGLIRAPRSATSQVLSWLDALGAALILAGGLFLTQRERRAQLQYGRYVRCSSQYTVSVASSSLPPRPKSLDALDLGLRRHFARVLSANVVDVNFFCKKTRRTIGLWRTRGQLALKVDAADARAKLGLETKKTRAVDAKARFKFGEAQRLIDEDGVQTGRVVACYVTFASVADRAACMKTYASSGMCQSQHKRFCGRALKVKQAAEPRDLRWEHLGHPLLAQCGRRMLVALAFGVLLLLSSAAIYRSKSWQRNREQRHPRPDCYLFRGEDRIRYSGEAAFVPSDGVGTLTMADVVRDETRSDPRGYVECFCGRMLSERGLGYTRRYEFESLEGAPLGRWCDRWLKRKAKSYGVTGAAISFVVGIELAMDYVAGSLTEVERHGSRTRGSVSHARKLAFLKVVNAAVLTTLIHGNLNGFPSLRRKAERKMMWFGFMRGDFDDFDDGWYATVGVAVALTLILSWVSELACYVLSFLAFHLNAWRDRSYTCDRTRTRQLTQEGLNRLVVGPTMHFEARYASLAKVLVASTLFSAGCPLLNVVCFLYFLTQYGMDKFLFTKFYAAPPTTTNALALLLSELIPFTIAARSIVAAWMWTAPSLVEDALQPLDDDDEVLRSAWAVSTRRIDHANALPHVLLVLIVVVGFAYRLLVDLLWCRASINDDDDNDTPYFRAIRTTTLERRVAERTLKPAVLIAYKAELAARALHPREDEPQFQTLESYDLRACPVYAGEFALDSRAVRRADRRSVGEARRSVGGARRSVGGARPASFRTSFGRGRESLESALDPEEEAEESSSDEDAEVWVDEREPDDGDRRSHAHRRSVGDRRRRRSAVSDDLPWHERWARDDRRRSAGASSGRASWDVGLPNVAVFSPPRPATPDSVAAFSPEVVVVGAEERV